MKHGLAATAALAAILASAQAQEAPPALIASPIAATDATTLPAAQGVRAVAVTGGLEAPWGMAWLPNGDILVTEQFGRLRLIRDGVLQAEPIAGVPAIYADRQGGLLDVSVHPNFAANHWIYLSYATGAEAENRLTVARARLHEGALHDLTVLLEAAPAKSGAQHFGSRFLWAPDGTLLIAIGDGGNPPRELGGALIREQAQRLDSHLGKILRIDDAGGVPADNPFLGAEGARPELFSIGHRNIQGLAFDPIRGRLYATEHGSQGGDELNLSAAGQTYGWPRATHGVEYGPERRLITPNQTLQGMIDPLAVWSPAIAPSGLAVYVGDIYPGWRGDLFVGALRINGSPNPGSLLRLDLDDAGAIQSQQRIDLGQVRVRDVRQGPDGHLYVLTTATTGFRDPGQINGVLWRLEPAG
jgi:glucose/arabinose dehydrogenase